MPFNDIVVANTTLIRDAIHSQVYTPGIAGWSINKDGTAEFANTTIRGTFIAGDVTIDSTGFHYHTATFDVLIANDEIKLKDLVQNVTMLAGANSAGFLVTQQGVDTQAFMTAGHFVLTNTVTGVVTIMDDGIIQISSNFPAIHYTILNGDALYYSDSAFNAIGVPSSQCGTVLGSAAGGVTLTRTVTFPVPFDTNYPVPQVVCNIPTASTVAGAPPVHVGLRATSVTRTGCVIQIYSLTGAGMTFTNQPFEWIAFGGRV